MRLYFKFLLLVSAFFMCTAPAVADDFCQDPPKCISGCEMVPRRTDNFGDISKAGVAFNYNYYDLIFVGKPAWQLVDYQSLLTEDKKPYNEFYNTPRPYKIEYVIKNGTGIDISNMSYIPLMGRAYRQSFMMPRHVGEGKTKEMRVCYNNFKTGGGSFLVFAKMHEGIDTPVIVRMTSTQKNRIDQKKLGKSDLVFSGHLTNAEYLENGSYTKAQIKILDVYKGSKISKNELLDIYLSLLEFKIPENSIRHNLKQKYIFYLKKEKIEIKGLPVYMIYHATEDVGDEIEMLTSIARK